MYLSSLLGWLPLTSLTLNSYKHEHDTPKELGNLTPYRAAPVFLGVEAELPDDCSVDRVMLVWLGFPLRNGNV